MDPATAAVDGGKGEPCTDAQIGRVIHVHRSVLLLLPSYATVLSPFGQNLGLCMLVCYNGW